MTPSVKEQLGWFSFVYRTSLHSGKPKFRHTLRIQSWSQHLPPWAVKTRIAAKKRMQSFVGARKWPSKAAGGQKGENELSRPGWLTQLKNYNVNSTTFLSFECCNHRCKEFRYTNLYNSHINYEWEKVQRTIWWSKPRLLNKRANW